MPRYLISYDVSSARGRARICALLEKAGQRVQKSVFVVVCSENEYKNLVRELHIFLDKDDSLLCLPCCSQCFAAGTITGPAPPLLIIQ